MTRLCHMFGVHRSSYKYWVKGVNTIKPEQVELQAQVRQAYNESRGSAGARTIAARVSERGIPFSRYRAAKLMRKLALVSNQPPTHQYKKATREHLAIPNLLARQFTVAAPNQVWCGDVTYSVPGVHSRQGCLV